MCIHTQTHKVPRPLPSAFASMEDFNSLKPRTLASAMTAVRDAVNKLQALTSKPQAKCNLENEVCDFCVCLSKI